MVVKKQNHCPSTRLRGEPKKMEEGIISTLRLFRWGHKKNCQSEGGKRTLEGGENGKKETSVNGVADQSRGQGVNKKRLKKVKSKMPEGLKLNTIGGKGGRSRRKGHLITLCRGRVKALGEKEGDRSTGGGSRKVPPKKPGGE